MLTHITEGKSFLGIPPSEKVKALELDFESADALIGLRYDRLEIKKGKEFDNFQIFNLGQYSFELLVPFIKKFHKQFPFNLLIIDNMLTAFDTFDENDNAEAKKKVKLVRSLSIELDCATVVFHHPSKANQTGTRKGSGAFAWSRHADICLNYNTTTEEGVVEIEVAKNRWAEDKIPLYFKLEGDGRFSASDAPIGLTTSTAPIEKVQICILKQHGQWSRGELVKVVEGISGEKLSLIDKALRRLVGGGRIKNPKYGRYIIP